MNLYACPKCHAKSQASDDKSTDCPRCGTKVELVDTSAKMQMDGDSTLTGDLTVTPKEP